MHVVRRNPAEPPALEEFVTGVARPLLLVGAAESDEVRVIVASFEPGAHNHPHTHTFDQVLYTLEGVGFVETEDERVVVEAGDTVVVPAGVRHWHGAVDDARLRQLSIGVPGTSDFDGRSYGATE